MIIGARTAAWSPSGAPLPYDAEVEWLRGTGNQHIITDIEAANNVGVSLSGVTVSKTIASSNTKMFFGVFGSNNRYGVGITSNNIFGWWNVADNHFAARDLDGESISFNWLNSRTYSVGGTSRALSGDYNDYHTRIALWNALRGDTGQMTFSDIDMTLGGAKISIGAEVVRDFIPVRFTNENGESEGAMYDRVSGQLFRNAGTGAFVVGPDK